MKIVQSVVQCKEYAIIYCLTLWLPRLDVICLYTPGNAGPLVHMGRNAQHPVESTDPHRVTQLICVSRGNKAITLNGVVLGCLVIIEETCMPPTNHCQEKHRVRPSEQRFLCVRIAQPANECSLHLLTYMFSNGNPVYWIPPQDWVNRIC